MQLSKFLYLVFASTVLSAPAPTTTQRAAVATTSTKSNTPRALAPASPPTANDVQNSITNWALSVRTVNTYLNSPSNSSALTQATIYAKDEPVQLATLMKVPQLSRAGSNAGKVLMGNFPSIVSNLQNVQSGAMSTQDATMAVNFMRCCTVLPAIGTLWAAASKNATIEMPELQEQCARMSCAAGVSVGPANATLQSVV